MLSGIPVIRLGDSTTHDGVVVSAASGTLAWGKPIARMGDYVTCPIPGHGTCVIVEGDSTCLIDGRPIALHGHLTSCGASLISSMSNVVCSGAASPKKANTALAVSAVAAQMATKMEQQFYDEQPRLNVPANASLAGLPYFIKTNDGRTFSGTADEQGLLPRIATESAEDYNVYWGDEALVMMKEGE